MASIRPFKAILPDPAYAEGLVLTRPQVESVGHLKDLLETGARLRPETPEGQIAAYQAINETLATLIATKRLILEKTPGIYVYEVAHPGYRQTGIWALTHLEDYRDGSLKTHELTLTDSVRRLKNYRAHTGLEGSPVLLTYPPDATINRIIEHTKYSQKPTTLGNNYGVHRLWKIEKPEVQQQLIRAFAQVSTVYLADGHHRLESAEELAFETIMSLYLATDQLRIREFDRIVIPDVKWSKNAIIRRLSPNFRMTPMKAPNPIRPVQPHQFGMLAGGKWYRLRARKHIYEARDLPDTIDAALLQEYVLRPVFGIGEPSADPRLKCIGGGQAMEELLAFVAQHPCSVAFTLCPLSVDELIGVAEAGKTLPPKSTWIDPKVPYGLILYQHETN